MKKQIIYILGCIMTYSSVSFAQSDKVKFGAISRGISQQSTLTSEDTLNPNRNSSGEAVVDLRVNMNPNRKTEIGTVIRMESALGGFYGAGADISLRQLYVKGTLYDVVSYELGDIYLKLSPYTLYNYEAEGGVNEATVFSQLRNDLSYYDNFNIGNSWWSQGGHINFGFDLDSLFADGITIDLFTTRLQAPSTMRFMSGGKVSLFKRDGYIINANAIQVFDAQRVNPAQEALQNSVGSIELGYTLNLGENALQLTSEFGASNYKTLAPLESEENYVSPSDKKGEFITGRAMLELMDKKLKVGGRYLFNGAEYYAVGAQSKRVDFSENPELFLNVANNVLMARRLSLYDLVADKNIYNPTINGTLMNYDPRYGNALPYGWATPNRTGFVLEVAYTDSANVFSADLEGGLLSDVAGLSTSEKRSFTHIKASSSLEVGKLVGFKKQLKIYGGALYNKTTRGGLGSIDLTSTQIDLGLDIEVFKKLFLVSGVKMLTVKGNEYRYDLSSYNNYGIPTPYPDFDEVQLVVGSGFRYEFSENVYLSAKYFTVDLENKTTTNADYAFNQFMLFFSLKM